MENSVSVEFCRLCANHVVAGKCQRIFESNPEYLQIAEQLTGITMNRSKDLPQNICELCQGYLNELIKFRERCLLAENYFTSEEYRFIYLLADPYEKDNDYKDSYSEIDSNSQNAYIEYDENDTDDLNSKDNDAFTKDSEEYVEDEQDLDYILDTKEQDNVLVNVEFQCSAADDLKNNKNPSELSDEPQTTIGKKKRKQSKAKQSNSKSAKKRNDVEKKGDFICDQCGNHFTGRENLHRHLSRHTGNKRYQCEFCLKKYYTNSEYNRHRRCHTRERPFPCSMCDRFFSDTSARKRHERTHTDTRPYACMRCDKAFTASFLLKTHMLVHTRERAFECIPCNKLFLRRTHLTTHCNTLSHKENEMKSLQKVEISICNGFEEESSDGT